MRTKTIQWLGLPVLLALSGCGKDSGVAPGGEQTGAMELALTVAGLEVREVKLEIEGETNGVLRERTISVKDPNATISAKEGGLIAGDYEIRLSARPAVDVPSTPEDETKVLCKGGVSNIAVEAGKTTEVDDLVLVCTLDGGKVQVAGGIKVHATAVLDAGDLCEETLIEDAFVGALSTSVGTSVNLSAKVAAGASLAWSASIGSVGDASSANTVFTCPAEAGTAVVSLTASSGNCEESATVRVECVGNGEPLCGNGIVEAGEGCDDGNTTAESCAYGTPSCQVCGVGCQLTSAVGAYCGDGVVNGTEQCDGAANCTSTCTISVPNAVCGNNVVEAGEGCDDGNSVTEACAYGTPSCEVCGVGCQLATGVGPYCGDGIVNGAEQCDSAANCTVACTIVVAPEPVCGNNVVEAGEACDDGNSATEACAYGTPSCQVCGVGCQLVNSSGAYCGDGIVNGAEQCDGSANCTSTCTISVPNAVCGNNVVEAGEGCDDGNTVTEVCAYGLASCQVCGASCQVVAAVGPFCGDGVTNGLEECDGGAACSAECVALSLADQCEACIQNAEDADFRAFNETQCNNDPLCVDLKRCLINDTSDPVTTGRSCFNYIPATCYCGITTDFTPCETNPSFVAAGPCAAETIAAVGNAATPQEVFQRVTNTDYASGRAYQIVDFARQVCGQACGFTRVF